MRGIKRYGVESGVGTGGQKLPVARVSNNDPIIVHRVVLFDNLHSMSM